MIQKVRVELIEPDGSVLVGYQREEVVYFDYADGVPEKDDDPVHADVWRSTVEDAGATLLDWLEDAKAKVGRQTAALVRGGS